MRIDHHAYQRATHVAGLGLLLQIGVGLVLLLFGNLWHDTTLWIAATYLLIGVFLWLGLIIIFHQHKLERLEALEEDELTATRAAAGSFFDRASNEHRVAARRLAMMHKWLMPSLSLFVALLLGGTAWLQLRYLGDLDPQKFQMTQEKGWAIAICLSIAAISFIFSRFVAGMAKQTAWQNLRGGAAYMVGNALVMLGVSAGIIFRFFDNEHVIWAIAYAIPVLMILVALEITLNFILNLYRPRVPGEVPRPAFDSKSLSLLATPDSIVRSLNEAVNYQFGFDVTSSWGYQLLLRSFVSLLALGALAMILMSMMVIVEPHQQAVKLHFGRIVGDTPAEQIHGSGLMWKWPWPIETAEVYDVTSIRELHLTPKVIDTAPVLLWDTNDPPKTDGTIEPFIVGSPTLRLEGFGPILSPPPTPATVQNPIGEADSGEESTNQNVSAFYSLVDAEVSMQYRIKHDPVDPSKNGLLDYLHFGTENVVRRKDLNDRERALKALALSVVSSRLSALTLDQVLSSGQTSMSQDLRRDVQAVFDANKTGVEVLAVDFPMLRPSGNSAPSFEELNVSTQARQQRVAQIRSLVFNHLTAELGDASLADQVLAEIQKYNDLRGKLDNDAPEVIEQRQHVVDLLIKGGGAAAQTIADAESDRWSTLMEKRAQADRVQSQLAAYRAAPELYRQRELMKVWRSMLPNMDKFVIAIDPARVSIDADMKKINSILEFAGVSEDEKKKQ